ncbi:bifunctional diaminohydroxyphosphoribosylaminopyrimidine deaminase/5-amino-6-(5-phosphoribosylamino)uracil reductase RibD [Gymnodinialimonas sp. 2305UL16-5]|uniref:bifunctional diaminohydroxyphosphoribosylaminopyrimidine deaminase/5-amino-6-(5-phosphoribosylamino)uracil reductase RibD n=1 Tax=Gymnodinialimonas mytili TaxID=3126503 RepID=UPI0030A80961
MGSDARWMRVALALGARGLGRVWPNPAVGCVLVKDGRVVGRGSTATGGRPHAEVIALAQAGDAARGATAYVTLEPCSHHGQTGPCADALIAAGVARIVVACEDPNPQVAGAGIARLRDAGIDVELGVMAAEATEAHCGFFSTIKRGRPMLTLKIATSLDGRIATASGESQWITGSGARRLVHGMRANHDAVLVGAGTARADDPSLTVRDMGITRQPVRIVISRRLDLPVDSVLGRTAREVPVWLLHGPDAPDAARVAWAATGATLIECATGSGGQVDLADAMQSLAARGLTRIFCEGGGTLAAALLAGDLVDRLAVFSGGLILGAEGVPAVGAMGIAALSEAPDFDLIAAQSVAGDGLSLWRRKRCESD